MPVVPVDWPTLASSYQSAITSDQISRLASSLGVSASSLVRLGCGWSAEYGAYSFPMKDASGQIVGIRLRRRNGFKFAVKGSRQGLFLPDTSIVGQLLVVGEGPTDCAALLDMGLIAVGRPSCSAGTAILLQLVRRLRPPGVLIVADSDQPGQRGAKSLADVLSFLNIDLRIVTPPAGVKDAREWKAGGATAANILTAPAIVFPHPAIRRAKRHATQLRRTARS